MASYAEQRAAEQRAYGHALAADLREHKAELAQVYRDSRARAAAALLPGVIAQSDRGLGYDDGF